MQKVFKGNRNKLILIMVLCAFILICNIYLNANTQNHRVINTNVQSSGLEGHYKQLLVNTYLTKIIRASDEFYEEYYVSSPTVNYYSVFVKKITSDKGDRTFHVTFTSSPYIGPHDTIGVDEITFLADYLGNVKLEKFLHLKSYHLPDNLKDLEKKQFPENYYSD